MKIYNLMSILLSDHVAYINGVSDLTAEYQLDESSAKINP